MKPVVNEDLGERLASMKEQILSRSRVEPIIERFNLFPGGNRTLDDRVDLTRKAITVSPSARNNPGAGCPASLLRSRHRMLARRNKCAAKSPPCS